MDETIKNTTEEETAQQPISEMTDDKLKEAIEAQYRKFHFQGIATGSQAVCSVILDKIMTAAKQPGKRSMNDYRRLIKDIESLCRMGLSRKVNADGTITPRDKEANNEESTAEETVQN